MCVAQLRGVEFMANPKDPEDIQPVDWGNRKQAIEALQDVAKFFGYLDSQQGDAEDMYLVDLQNNRTIRIVNALNG